MPKNYQTLKLEKISDHILVVTLNRPEVRNAINSIMMKELFYLWSDLYPNAEGIRCIILTGSGEKAFCAGADLKERKDIALEIWQQQHAVLQQAMTAMVNCPIPIIASVNGAAYGGGLELILASDFAYASDQAVFAQSEVKIGIIPGAMGTQQLPRATGLRRAREITYTALPFNAEQAFEWGVINKVYPAEELMKNVTLTARLIAENAPLAVMQAKKALRVAPDVDLKTGYAFEVEAYNRLLPTEDRVEGVRAFNEKRKPNFNGK
jgi:enoyl-CoA hydratase